MPRRSLLFVSLCEFTQMKGSSFWTAPIVVTIGFLACGFSGMKAQDTSSADSGVVSEVGALEIVQTEKIPEVKTAIEMARPAGPTSVPTPKFTIRTRNNQFMMTVGGVINPIFGYDMGNNLYAEDGINFVTGDIPVPALTGHKGRVFINPLNSKVDFTVVGLGGTENQITGYVRLSMNGVNSSVRMNRAYIRYRGFTVGENSTLALDEAAGDIPQIDPQGPNGLVNTANYQISYRSRDYSGFRFAVGLEMPTFYAASGRYLGRDYMSYYGHMVESEVDQLVPDVPMWVEYGKGNNRVRFTGIIRNFAYQDMLKRHRYHEVGWGAMISGNFQFYKPLLFYYQAVYGKGIGNYIQDIAGRPISFTPRSSQPGRVDATPMMGLMFGASYQATPRLSFNAVGSFAKVWGVKEYATVNDATKDDANGNSVMTAGSANYHYGSYFAVNCFYKITSYLRFGVEYLYGRRTTYTLGSAHDNRLQTQLSLSF